MNIKRDRKMLSDIGRTGDLMKRTASLGLSFLMLFEILRDVYSSLHIFLLNSYYKDYWSNFK